MRDIDIFIPSRYFIEGLEEGGTAPDCFGDWNVVTGIFAQTDDIEGRAYVCYYTQFGEHSRISNGLKEGKINRTISVCVEYTSHQLDMLERIRRCRV